MTLDLPDLDALLELSCEDQGVVLHEAIVRTWLTVDGYNSAAGRRQWFRDWRAWLDVAELRAGWPRESTWLWVAAMDALEKQTSAGDAAVRN